MSRSGSRDCSTDRPAGTSAPSVARWSLLRARAPVVARAGSSSFREGRRQTSSMSDAAAHKEAIIRWLHLSDLHFGCPGREAWWQAHDVFRRSIVELSAELGGPPHLVLITGDLTYSGQRKEFDQLDQFCSALSGWISQGSAAGRPLLVAVPGNHDVTRPGDEAFRYAYLDLYEEEHLQSLRHKLWEKRDSGPVRPLFKSYQAWVQREMLPRLEARRSNTADGVLEFRTSYFPGDFSLILGVGGFRLGLVGLNSAWMQYREGDFQGRLQLPASQFLAALPQSQGHPLDFFKRCQRTMLLTHHPVDWLAPRARAEFENQVLLP
ncbi:MAG: hypothetical protein FJ125_16670, partial [Deltaproteobacteria bacterium]|nr:hypothetical protein [Deltaproteobacteria bacterium]